ncbi:hypothetical protein HDV06_005897 [Boothiomyces sp. JEL0866]|nr:hypothetical protein HDV06_005897 [Boothiomyces sp. JEL0866]
MKISLLAGVALAGVNDNGSPCYIGNCWNNHTELASWILSGPVWSDDGTVGMNFELTYERKLEIPPLDVFWAERNFYYRLVTQKIGGQKQYLTGLQKGRPSIDYLYFMKSAGYALVKIYDDVKMVTTDYKVGTDGTFTSLPPADYIPSPNGQVLSSLNCGDSSCALNFVDSKSLKTVGNPFTFNITAYPTVRWTSGNELVVSDLTANSFSINPFGNLTSTPIPTCLGVATTSSKINSNGDLIGVTTNWLFGDNMAVVGKASVSQKFDCK